MEEGCRPDQQVFRQVREAQDEDVLSWRRTKLGRLLGRKVPRWEAGVPGDGVAHQLSCTGRSGHLSLVILFLWKVLMLASLTDSSLVTGTEGWAPQLASQLHWSEVSLY